MRAVRAPGLALILVVVLLLGRAASAEERRVLSPTPGAYDAFSQFASFLDIIIKNYADASNLALRVQTTESLRAFVRALDPDADLVTPADRTETDQQPVPFGALLATRDGQPTIISVRDGSTAQLAGLLPGERLAAINDEPTTGAQLADLTRQLAGPVGTKFLLKIIDPVTGPRDQLVERHRPPPPRPALAFLAQGAGYCRLPEFTPPAVEQLLLALDRAKAERIRSLILDLRNNPGGSLDAVVIAAGQFLPAQTEVTTLAYARAERAATFVTPTGEPFTAPVALLVNAGTAAEAEVFAAALQAHRRARLVGAPTAGRGRHLERYRLPDGTLLTLPTAYFEAPGAKRFHETGLTPDVPVEVHRDIERQLATAGYHFTAATDLALQRALELLK